MFKTRYSQRSRQRLCYCVPARVSAHARVQAWTYDANNRLIEVQDTTGGQTNPAATLIARYGYDPLDRRIWKEQYRNANGQGQSNPLAPAQRTYYLYADEGLIAESTQAITLNADGSVSASSTPQITTQYGPRPDSEYTTGTLFVKTKNSNNQDTASPVVAYFHHDHLQTPLQATDKAGNVVWAASYNAFGKASITTPAATADKPTITVNLRLPGQYLDEETGLHYNWHRYYDGEIGRYLTEDPIKLSGGVNRYGYVEGNPLSMTDPMGLMGNGPSGGNKWTPVNKGGYKNHDYTWKVFRCMGNCTEQTMRELRCNPAPGANPKTPIDSGDSNIVNLGPMELGPITTIINPSINTTWNVTAPGHMLHPGWVRREVVFDGSATWVVNTGGGTGFNPLNLNTILAPIVWGGENPRRLPKGACGCE
jgi:RHS repeat-associated protein